MAFWDFFVPKARPRLLRAERYYRIDRLVLKSGDIWERLTLGPAF